jgi:hypothetical protein
MKAARLALVALACSAPLLASAQWQWVDKDGRKVFSDRAPPSDIAPNRIVRQPGGPAAAPVAEPAATTAAAAPAAAVPKLSGTDKGLEEKRKQLQAAEAEKKKAEDEKFALARSASCSRAKTAKATHDTGMRIMRTNEKGEREFLDDGQRAAEAKRLDEVIAKDCAP